MDGSKSKSKVGSRAPAKRVAGRRYGSKPKTVKKTGSKLATVSLVKKMIHRNMENKIAGYQATNIFNPQINTSGDAYGLMPSIGQGTGDNARIGNRITPRGLLVTFNVFVAPEQQATPGQVFLPRVLILSQKSTDGYTPGLTVDFSRLLEYGAGEQPFDGTLTSYRAPVNTDVFRVHKDIRTKIALGNGDENLSVISKTYKVWVPCPKVLTYADGQSYPQNFSPFICLGWADGQGVNYSPLATMVAMNWTSTLYYEDA